MEPVPFGELEDGQYFFFQYWEDEWRMAVKIKPKMKPIECWTANAMNDEGRLFHFHGKVLVHLDNPMWGYFTKVVRHVVPNEE